jgi:hypothetical protein
METKFRLNNNQTMVMVLLGAVLFFIFVLPMIDSMNKKSNIKVMEGLANTNSIPKLDTNLCSKQCCKHVQWPVPIDMKVGDIPEKDLAKYIPTNFSCNFGKGSGCVCATKSDFDYLANRGNNIGSQMCK